MEVGKFLTQLATFVAYSATPVIAAVFVHRAVRSRSLPGRLAGCLGVVACVCCGYVLARNLL